MRINKFLSKAGYCSRRQGDHLINQGQVQVNGQVVDLGYDVLEDDIVMIKGEIIEIRSNDEYIAFNKPVGITVTTAKNDPSNIIDYINYSKRIFPVGRLDKDSEGLILLTDDGDIVNKILKSSNNHEKEYIVTVDKKITPKLIKNLSCEIPLEVGVTKKSKVTALSEYTFKIILTQGLNRQIRRMCNYYDYNVVKLKRVRVINIKLKDLPVGEYRKLNQEELKVLFEQIGYKKKVSD